MRLSTERTKKVEIPGDPDAGYINIRALSVEELANIESKSSNTVMGSTGDVTLSVDSYSRDNGVAYKCINGWGNMFDVNGSELKFTADSLNKVKHVEIMIDGKKTRFLEWVSAAHADFLKEISEQEKESLGN